MGAPRGVWAKQAHVRLASPRKRDPPPWRERGGIWVARDGCTGVGGGRGGDQWTAVRGSGNGPSLPTWHGEVRRCKVSAGGGEAAGE